MKHANLYLQYYVLIFWKHPKTHRTSKAHARRGTDGQWWTTRCTELVCVSGSQHAGKSGWLFCWWGDTRGLWWRDAEVEDGKGAQNFYAFQPLRTSVSLAAWRLPGPWSLGFLWGLYCKGLVAGRLGRDTQQALGVESLPFLSMAFLLTRNEERSRGLLRGRLVRVTIQEPAAKIKIWIIIPQTTFGSSHQPVVSWPSSSGSETICVSNFRGFEGFGNHSLLLLGILTLSSMPAFSSCFLSHGESVATVCLCHILPVMHVSSSSLCVRGQFRKLPLPSFPSEIPSDGESGQVFSLASSHGGGAGGVLPCDISGLG